MDSHAAVAAQFVGRPRINAFLRTWTLAEHKLNGHMSERDRKLRWLTMLVNRHAMMKQELPYIRSILSDEEIASCISVVALFNFYNTWVDGHAIEHQTPAQYEASGKRLFERGYLIEEVSVAR